MIAALRELINDIEGHDDAHGMIDLLIANQGWPDEFVIIAEGHVEAWPNEVKE